VPHREHATPALGPMSELAGKVLVVTGADRGSGASAARLFAERGASVVLGGRDEQALSELAAEIAWDEGEALQVPTDVTRLSAVEHLIAAAIDRYGRLDGAFNCARIAARRRDSLDQIDPHEFEDALTVNLRSVFFCLRCELRWLTAGGAVVNICSSTTPLGASGTAAQSAATHGVIGLARAAAHDYGSKGLRINTIAAGPVATENGVVTTSEEIRPHGVQALTPGRAMTNEEIAVTNEEIAQLAGWLLSDAASMVNGAVISIDGSTLAAVDGLRAWCADAPR
jgi:A-factor type gamma-butyrolactone 1'-reductase (1S-forming)